MWSGCDLFGELEQMLAGSRYAEHLVAKKAFQQEDDLDIVRAIATLATCGAYGAKKFCELTLPIPKRVDFDAGNFAGNADANRTFRFGLTPRLDHRRNLLLTPQTADTQQCYRYLQARFAGERLLSGQARIHLSIDPMIIDFPSGISLDHGKRESLLEGRWA